VRTSSAHLRGIVIAGALAALALALGFVTMAMNQTASKAATHIVLPLSARHHEAARTTSARVKAKPKPKPVDPNLQAALSAGLPAPVARALGARPVAVIQITSAQDPVARLTSAEAQSGATLAGASYATVSVDRDGGAVAELTRTLGTLPVAPATLVYVRPAKIFLTLSGFNDRTTIQQAAENAAASAQAAGVQTNADWPTRAALLCRQASTELSGLGNPGSPARLAAHKVEFEAIAAGFLAQFGALTPPAGQSAQVGQLDTLLTKSFAAEDAAVAAQTMHDLKALAAANKRVVSFKSRIGTLEGQLGASGCAELAA
jgi:hypothetical protein